MTVRRWVLAAAVATGVVVAWAVEVATRPVRWAGTLTEDR